MFAVLLLQKLMKLEESKAAFWPTLLGSGVLLLNTTFQLHNLDNFSFVY